MRHPPLVAAFSVHDPAKTWSVGTPCEHRVLFWALLGLILFGLVFGGYTVLDFNRLRRSGQESAVPIAAGIFLNVLNIFLFFLQLFGGDND